MTESGALAAGATTRRRVLIAAYAVSPDRGSEPGMGWNICSRLARHHDVTVICAPGVPPDAQDFRGEIDTYLRRHPIEGLTFEFVEPPLMSYLLQRESPLLRRTLYYAGYRSWQRAARRVGRTLHARQPFDVVHQLNITTFREPGYLWTLPGVPFVWGPVGGAADIPPAFLPMMSASERAFYRARQAANAVQKQWSTRWRRAARHASHIWAVGDANRDLMRSVQGCDAQAMLEAGAEASPLARHRTYDGRRPLELVWSGQHIGRKALPLLLHALSLAAPTTVRVTVLGTGPESPGWHALAARLGLERAVRWTGHVPREQALSIMSEADAFVSTSVLEETSMVILEALALGLPVVCHDACGMRVAVTEDCGVRIPMADPATSIRAFRTAILALRHEGTLAKLSAGALRRAEDLDWDRKAEAIARVYGQVAAAAARTSSPGWPALAAEEVG